MYEKYFDILKENCLDSRIHGYNHAKHVFIIAEKILESFPKANKDIVLTASIFHDCKRKTDGKDERHSDLSANWFDKNFKTKDKRIKQLIRDHNKQVDSPSLELKILKDADCLSRVRFDNFIPNYLLIPEISYYLLEWSRDEWLKLQLPDAIHKTCLTEYNKALEYLKKTPLTRNNYLLLKRGLFDLCEFTQNRHFLLDVFYWRLFRQWLSANYHNQMLQTLILLLKDRPNNFMLMQYTKEVEKYRNLPEYLTIYRGCTEKNMNGLSWSLNKDEAGKYCEYGGFIKEKKIHRKDVVALFLDNDKAEVLIYPEK